MVRCNDLKRASHGHLLSRARFILLTWVLWIGLAHLAFLWGFYAAGALLIAMSALTYLFPPAMPEPIYALDDSHAVDSPEFKSTLCVSTGHYFSTGNQIRILRNGQEIYGSMLSEIAQARHSVTIEAYIYWAGKIGLRFANALAERARAGVSVKILLDAVGSWKISSEITKLLEQSGCQLQWYNKLELISIGRINNRTHRKSLIIDGKVAFTGGPGIADIWFDWRDTAVRIEGPAVAELQGGFTQNWLKTTQELVTGPVFHPPLKPAGDTSALTILSSPEAGASNVRLLYFLAIVGARRRILISNAYFAPDQSILNALKEARTRRGVEVIILVPGECNDSKVARHNGIRLYGQLLECGVRIFEYQPVMIHQKVMVVDGRLATLGTTNLDVRSLWLHEESNICLDDTELCGELETMIEDDLTQAREITLEDWRQRGWIQRSKELLLSLIREHA